MTKLKEYKVPLIIGVIFWSIVSFMSYIPRATAISEGLFSIKCGGSHTLTDDPIVYPAEPGVSHMHRFLGNKTTDAFSTYEGMLRQGTTCKLTDDTAAYWVPSLMLNGEVVPAINGIVYYRGNVGETVSHPPDLRIIAGGDHAGWTCVGDGGKVGVRLIPNCGDKNVKANIHFPDCWDGDNLDSPNHLSHLAYSVAKVCPSSHPVHLPRIALHVTFQSNGVGAELSSDMGAPAGSTLHADFWNTWNQSSLDRLVELCINQDQPCKMLTAMPLGA